jgi:hypothetical protein
MVISQLDAIVKEFISQQRERKMFMNVVNIPTDLSHSKLEHAL